jgi:hypothetical protein
MATLATMRSRISDDLLRTDIDTQIDKAINRAIEYYEKERFWFSETTGTFTTVASQQAYSSSNASFIALLAEIDLVRVTLSASNIYALDLSSYAEILNKDTGNFTSTPSEYAFYKQNIYLYPTPNDAWTVTVSYQKKYAELALAADTNDFTTDAEDLIEARARWWLYSRVIKDMEQAQIAKAEEIEALTALRIKTNKLTSTGQINHTDF